MAYFLAQIPWMYRPVAMGHGHHISQWHEQGGQDGLLTALEHGPARDWASWRYRLIGEGEAAPVGAL